jgi:hypothetical protein
MLHTVAVEKDGYPYEFQTYEFNTNEFPEALEVAEYDYDYHISKIIENIKLSGKTNILIFIHGGMNKLDNAIARAGEQTRLIDDTTSYYPIFVNWNSAMMSSYFENLFELYQGKRSHVIAPIMSPFVFMRDSVSAIMHMPIIALHQWYGWKKNPVKQPVFKENTPIPNQHGKDYSSDALFVIHRAVYGMCYPVRLITTPVIDAFGNRAWHTMNRRTRTLFRKPDTIGEAKGTYLPGDYAVPDGGLGILMNTLAKLVKEDPKYTITLVGHSMGTIVINEILNDYHFMEFDKIVYMAAACSVNDVENSVVPYLQIHKNTTFYHLTLHQTADETESSWESVVGRKSPLRWLMIVPRGSLLEWIDFYLSDPYTPGDYTAGKWANFIAGMPRIPNDVRSQMRIKAFGIMDPVLNIREIDKPEVHGDFTLTGEKFWLPDYWEITDKSTTERE